MTESEAQDHWMAQWIRGTLAGDRSAMERATKALDGVFSSRPEDGGGAAAATGGLIIPAPLATIHRLLFPDRRPAGGGSCGDPECGEEDVADTCMYCHRSYCACYAAEGGHASECRSCGARRDDGIATEAILRNALREAVRT